jgi:hypothetical protein
MIERPSVDLDFADETDILLHTISPVRNVHPPNVTHQKKPAGENLVGRL